MKRLLIFCILICGLYMVTTHISNLPKQTKEQCHNNCTYYVNTITDNLGSEMHQCLLECAERTK